VFLRGPAPQINLFHDVATVAVEPRIWLFTDTGWGLASRHVADRRAAPGGVVGPDLQDRAQEPVADAAERGFSWMRSVRTGLPISPPRVWRQRDARERWALSPGQAPRNRYIALEVDVRDATADVPALVPSALRLAAITYRVHWERMRDGVVRWSMEGTAFVRAVPTGEGGADAVVLRLLETLATRAVAPFAAALGPVD
jgi:hypothetical protein